MHDRAGETANGADALLPDQLFTRALNGITHLIEGKSQTSQFVVAFDRNTMVVMALCHLACGLIQAADRSENLAGQQVSEKQTKASRYKPDEDDIAFQAVKGVACTSQ